ncbi:hypothetical protein BBW65_04955 [Helicobacter enhydrae]|uniref:TonB-dependent receptor plug domain-containing protein n=1 Tax=Helicobacter enhydrae TaxID=222136 RepID=A0A1B1U671_9HELI|nr:TonB-dependent receptor [Helicobacter enhydrae]ANV98185.1 hypothetical protein BBW65_04955 [Helicobacter enhydrae]
MKTYIGMFGLVGLLWAQQDLQTPLVDVETQQYATKAESSQSSNLKNAQMLEDHLINTTTELPLLFPSLQMYPQGSDVFPMITLRGMSGPDFYSYVLGLYVDGVPQSPNFMLQVLGDVESVRLINGAEGLFYGENAPLGLIEIKTKNPLQQNYAKASISASNLQEEVLGEIGWNLVPSQLWLKANVRYLHDNGYLKDPKTHRMLNTGDSVTTGFTLYYLPFVEMLVTAHYDYHYTLTHKDFFLSKSQIKDLSFGSGEQIGGYEEYQQGVTDKIFNLNPFNRFDAHNANVKIDYYFADSTLSSITAFQKVDTLGNTYPGIFVQDNGKDGYYYNTYQMIEELKLHHYHQYGIESIFGAYYKFFFLDNGMDNVPTGSPSEPPLYYDGTWRAMETINTAALYGDVSLPYGDWLFNLGLRYQIYHSKIDTPLPPMRPNMQPYTDSALFNALNARVNLIYRIDSNHQVFTQLSNTTKPGGFSKFPFADTDTLPYQQEQIYTFEFGYSGKFLDTALRLDSSAYGLLRTHAQAYVGEGYNKSIANIGDVYAVGMDVELSYRGEIFGGFLSSNVSYARFGKDSKNEGFLIINNTPSHYDVRGLTPRFSPLLSLSAGADWVLFAHADHQITLSSLIRFSSGYFLDDFNHEEDLRQKPFVLMNASLNYRFLRHYELNFFTENLTNTRYITSVLWDGKGRAYTSGDPISFGVRLTYDY